MVFLVLVLTTCPRMVLLQDPWEEEPVFHTQVSNSQKVSALTVLTELSVELMLAGFTFKENT
jgi:hypothetical protein